MTLEGQETANGTRPVAESVCKEKVKRIDGDIAVVDKKADNNRHSIERLNATLISTLSAAVLNLIGIIVIVFKMFTGA